jgi:hypothetical protein
MGRFNEHDQLLSGGRAKALAAVTRLPKDKDWLRGVVALAGAPRVVEVNGPPDVQGRRRRTGRQPGPFPAFRSDMLPVGSGRVRVERTVGRWITQSPGGGGAWPKGPRLLRPVCWRVGALSVQGCHSLWTGVAAGSDCRAHTLSGWGYGISPERPAMVKQAAGPWPMRTTKGDPGRRTGSAATSAPARRAMANFFPRPRLRPDALRGRAARRAPSGQDS